MGFFLTPKNRVFWHQGSRPMIFQKRSKIPILQNVIFAIFAHFVIFVNFDILTFFTVKRHWRNAPSKAKVRSNSEHRNFGFLRFCHFCQKWPKITFFFEAKYLQKPVFWRFFTSVTHFWGLGSILDPFLTPNSGSGIDFRPPKFDKMQTGRGWVANPKCGIRLWTVKDFPTQTFPCGKLTERGLKSTEISLRYR